MIHILLLSLKIIGILLLAVMILALLLLFFPVVYKGSVQYSESKKCGKITAGWLFHIIHLAGQYDGIEVQYSIRILGIPIISSKKKNQKHHKTKSKKTKKNLETDLDCVSIEKQSEEQENKSALKVSPETVETKDTKRNYEKQEKRYKEKKKEKFTDKGKRILKNIKNKIKNITYNIRKSNNKLQDIKAFVQGKTTKEAWKYGKTLIIKLVRHIFPKKVRGRLHFGFEKPHITGEALGWIAVIFGTLGMDLKHIIVEPDFEKKILEGKVTCKGYILLGVAGLYILKIYFNKDIRDIIEKFS